MRVSRPAATLVWSLAIVFSTAAFSVSNVQAQTFTNPIDPSQNADPFVLNYNGLFYFVGTNSIGVIRYDPRLENVVHGAGSCSVAGAAAQGGEAPELFEWNGHAYYIVTTGSGNNTYVYQSDSANPCGNYTLMNANSPLFPGGWDVDMYQDPSGTLWAAAKGSGIVVAQMTNPWTMATSPVTVTNETYSWETTGYMEGPEFFTHTGMLFMDYSTGNWYDSTYKLGLLTFTGTPGQDRLDNASLWSKSPNPIYQSANGVYGPGHNSVVVDGAGTYWNVYGAHPDQTNSRQISIQPISWSGNVPNFGQPVGLGVAINDPSPLSGSVASFSGNHTVVNVNSGKCIANPASSGNAGTQMIQWTCDGLSDQNWTMTKNSDATYTLVNGASNYCLDYSGGSPNNNTPIIQEPCNTSNGNQHFFIVPSNSGGYQIETSAGSCVDVFQESTADGVNIEEWQCSGRANEAFHFN